MRTSSQDADIGVYGLGTMGSALALNLAQNGFRVSVSNREADWIDNFLNDSGALRGQLQGAAVGPQILKALACTLWAWEYLAGPRARDTARR